MWHLGLGDKLVNLIMSCISSVLILCSLMVSLWDLLNRNEVFVRVILYHPISFSCVHGPPKLASFSRDGRAYLGRSYLSVWT